VLVHYANAKDAALALDAHAATPLRIADRDIVLAFHVPDPPTPWLAVSNVPEDASAADLAAALQVPARNVHLCTQTFPSILIKC
jgi:hypothetical protein